MKKRSKQGMKKRINSAIKRWWYGKPPVPMQTDTETVEETVYQQATEKFLSLHEEQVELEDWQAFQAWLAKSDENSQAMTHVDQLWSDMGKLDTIPWPTEEELAQDTYDGELPLGAASKAADKTDKSRIRHEVITWPRFWLAGAGMAATVLLAVFYIKPLLDAPDIYQTGMGEHQLVGLDDGTEILLGAKTTAMVSYSNNIRQVDLQQGEALFTVAKDPGRPFLVASGSTSVVAVGTRFNVRYLADQVEVSVLEGIVNVSTEPVANYRTEKLIEAVTELSQPASSTPSANKSQVILRKNARQLTVGQQIRLSESSAVSDVYPVADEEVLSWRDGLLFYSGDPLKTVVADVSRYYPQTISLLGSELNHLTFSGTVNKDEIDDWLNGLESVYGVRVVKRDNEIVIVGK